MAVPLTMAPAPPPPHSYALDPGDLQAIITHLKAVVFQTDATGLWTYLNPAWEEITGFRVSESLGRLFLDSVHPDDRQENVARFQPLVERHKECCRHEVRYLCKGGGWRWVEVYARLMLDKHGNVLGTTGTLIDVTDRRLASEERERTAELLRRRETVLQAVNSAAKRFLRSPDWRVEIDATVQQFCAATGSRRVLLYKDPEDGSPAEVAGVWPRVDCGEPDGATGVVETVPVVAGAAAWGRFVFELPPAHSWSDSTRLAVKSAADMLGTAIARERSERDLRWREALYDAMANSATAGLYVVDSCDEQVLLINHSFCRMAGLDALPAWLANGGVTPSDIRRSIRSRLADPDGLSVPVLTPDVSGECQHYDLVLNDGRTLVVSGAGVRDADHTNYGYLFVLEDATVQRNAEAAMRSANEKLELRINSRTAELAQANDRLRDSEQLYRTVVETSPTALILAGMDDVVALANVRAHSLLGFDPMQDLTGMHVTELLAPESGRLLQSMLHEAQSGVAAQTLECELRKLDGASFFADIFSAAAHGKAGAPRLAILAIRDVTRRKELEAQVLQAQKMEAVGRLAGGVAHDFNNLLTVIKGYSELLARKLPPDDPAGRKVAQISKAAERAAALVGQLLAFSRKQVVEPRLVDVNQAIRDLEKMLRRLIGENIELRTELDPTAGSIIIDPTQFDQIVINFVVNSRDAIADTGVIRIRTRRVSPEDAGAAHQGANAADHVSVAVHDDGAGMSDEVKSKIFEPFFTTKEVGKGTGLGLSTVYGIVEQAGAHLVVDSTPGEGTIMEVQFTAAVEDGGASKSASVSESGGGVETVLVVEDEDLVRAMVVESLEERGYKVLQARDGIEAREIAANDSAEIDLVITDLIMPRMGGLRLKEELSRLRPYAKVLLMSGYPEHAAPEAGWLHKPFDPAALVRRVREILA